MKEQFSGVSTDDVVAHLNIFFDLCEMQKYKDVDGDIIKLKLFPFSLRGRPKDWLLSLPRNLLYLYRRPPLADFSQHASYTRQQIYSWSTSLFSVVW
jgi:hypothetical protein